MMRNSIRASALAILCSGVGLFAQAGATTQAPQPQTQTKPSTAAAGSTATTTLSGCVYREQDVPGRAPNVAERAGVLEDYILAEVSSSGSSAGSSTAGTPGAVGTSGTSKSGAMYKLELATDDKLKAVVGKRVEVTGRIDAEAGDKTPATGTPATSATDRAIGRDRIDLPEFEVTSIKEVAGTCPATPSAK
jgi:hypothetical protein